MMLKYFALSALICATSTTVVNAWGQNGHSAVGVLIQRLLSPNALNGITKLLKDDPDVQGDFGKAATWADRIKSRGDTYRWASPLHYVDIEGESADTCGTYKESDCPNGVCIISGIANYTERVSCDKPAPGRIEAIKFLIHFLGDIGQPLHATGVARGGNDFVCFWGQKRTNLHSVWDGSIIDKTINGNFNTYVNKLEKDIRTGKYASQKSEWLNCFNGQKTDLNACAIAWANESNKFNCDYIFPTYEAGKENGKTELSQSYYQENAERVNMFVARAAVRGAQYFETVLGSCNAFVPTLPQVEDDHPAAAPAA
ncbi:S1/P1 nuclease [Syncephalis fuscata]|nr:S1/P1 nuclease [Syncephalis fuscata]